jgi:hypothetical protein
LPDLERRAPDLDIRLGEVPDTPDPTEGWRPISPFVQVAEGRFRLRVPGVARFAVDHGCRVRVRPQPGIDAASVRVFLLGSVLGAVMFQRGFLVLHGNAIDVGGRAMVCLGPSGPGSRSSTCRRAAPFATCPCPSAGFTCFTPRTPMRSP